MNEGKVIKKYNTLKFFNYFILFLIVFAASTFLTYYLNGGVLNNIPNFLKEYKTLVITLPEDLVGDVKKSIEENLGKINYKDVKRFSFGKGGDVIFSWKEGSGMYDFYVVPVSHLYNLNDNFTEKEKIYIDSTLPEGIRAELKKKYISSKESSDIDSILDENGKNVVLISPSSLKGTYKLLKYKNNYFLDNTNGGLVFSLVIEKPKKFVEKIITSNLPQEEYSKYKYKLEETTTFIQTGVTAISRDLAFKIEGSNDNSYPSKKISSFLKSADITHTSNEVSSVPGCVPAQSMRFCAKPEYVKSLTESGIDIVELTGNHNNDFGADNNLNTIKQYEKLGMKYFGGGKDKTDASKILYVENKGNKIAFIGYNYYDTILGTGALAGDDRAGANSYSDSKMKKDIANARKNANIVIVDFQFQECYSYPSSDVIYPICYKPLASPDQKGVFRKAIDYGADIVVGTQAHQPQTYEIYKGKTIFYGLGNLFFDQIEWIGTRQGLILTHYFRNGKYIQTKISTTLYNNDMQVFISKSGDRELLLRLLKEARD